MVAPNFAVGAVLMMEFAERAAKYFEGGGAQCGTEIVAPDRLHGRGAQPVGDALAGVVGRGERGAQVSDAGGVEKRFCHRAILPDSSRNAGSALRGIGIHVNLI